MSTYIAYPHLIESTRTVATFISPEVEENTPVWKGTLIKRKEGFHAKFSQKRHTRRHGYV
uniref:Uncharacterized protein n=1 Tax=Arion vulgaris TaxID=1028688 RepID=A0A0B6Z8Z4_9EUPU